MGRVIAIVMGLGMMLLAGCGGTVGAQDAATDARVATRNDARADVVTRHDAGEVLVDGGADVLEHDAGEVLVDGGADVLEHDAGEVLVDGGADVLEHDARADVVALLDGGCYPRVNVDAAAYGFPPAPAGWYVDGGADADATTGVACAGAGGCWFSTDAGNVASERLCASGFACVIAKVTNSDGYVIGTCEVP